MTENDVQHDTWHGELRVPGEYKWTAMGEKQGVIHRHLSKISTEDAGDVMLNINQSRRRAKVEADSPWYTILVSSRGICHTKR